MPARSRFHAGLRRCTCARRPRTPTANSQRGAPRSRVWTPVCTVRAINKIIKLIQYLTIVVGGAGSGVLRPRLVTAGSGGPGHRPPGITTWLRGASLHGSGGNAGDGSAAPGRKPPWWSAERRASRVMGRAAPHLRGSVASLCKRDKRNSAPVGAPPTPLRVGCEWKIDPGAEMRSGNEEDCAV